MTCGAGSRSQERVIEQKLANGGNSCEGQPIKNEICKKKDCPGM